MEYVEELIFKELPETKSDCEFTNCEFSEVNFKEATFSGCLFIDCNFTNCNISQSKFIGCSFRDTKFKGCRLVGINWTNASQLVSFSFDDCQINYSIFLGMKLNNFECINSQAKGCDFSEAKLINSNFSKTDLFETNFHNANCEKASFSDSKNYFINPSFTKIKDATFSYPEALTLLNSFEIKIDNLN